MRALLGQGQTPKGEMRSRAPTGDDGAILRPLLRYWMVSLPILILAAGAAIYLDANTEPSYEASGLFLLADPSFQPDRVAATIDTGELVEDFRASSAAEGAGEGRVVAIDRDATTVDIVGRGPSAALAQESLAAGIDWFEARLQDTQDAAAVEPGARLYWRLPARTAPTLQAGGVYEVETAMTLEAPSGPESNPLGANRDTGELLHTVLTSPQVEERIEATGGGTVDVSISGPDSIRFPVLGVRVEGPDSEAVMTAFREVIRIAEEEIEERQVRAGVPLLRRIFLDVVVEPGGATETTPRLAMSAIATVILGFVLALACTVWLEVRERRRSVDEPMPRWLPPRVIQRG